MGAKPKRRRSTLRIVLSVLLLVLVVTGGLYYYQIKRDHRLLRTALDNAAQVVNSANAYALDISAVTTQNSTSTMVSVTGQHKNGVFSGKGKVQTYLGAIPVVINGNVRVIDNTVYMQPTDLANALDNAIKADPSLTDYKNYVQVLADEYSDKWISAPMGNQAQECSKNGSRPYYNGSTKPIGSAATKISDAPKGQLHYRAQTSLGDVNTLFNQDTETQFEAIGWLQCAPSTHLSVASAVTADIWVNTSTRTVEKFVFSSGSESVTVVIGSPVGQLDWSKVTKPTDATPLSDVQKSLENIIGSPLKT